MKSIVGGSTAATGITRRGNQTFEIRFALITVLSDAREARREERPQDQPRDREHRVRNAVVGRHLRQAAEEDAEHDRQEDRLKHRPGDADGRLLVANRDVAAREEIDELAVPPDRLRAHELGTGVGVDRP